MVINTSVPSASLPSKPSSLTKSANQPAATGEANALAGLNLPASSESLATDNLGILSDAEAQQSTDAAVNSIFNQSTIALLAHGQHQSQTVIDLLAQ